MRPFRKHSLRRPRAWFLRASSVTERTRRGSPHVRELSLAELAAIGSPAFAAGVALEYFFDPRSGRRRRRIARERTRAAFRRRAHRVERHAHYEAGKVAGIAHRITHRITHRGHLASELDDVSLVRKVESELFRDRTIPKGQISLNADGGIVVLRGQLEDQELIRRIDRDVRRVAGVRDVENLLHLPSVPPPMSRPHRNRRAGRTSA
jgi:hypothetical protein